MIAEDPSGHLEQLADRGIPQCVANGQALLLGRDDALVAEHSQLLRHDWLHEAERVLQLLHCAIAAHQDFENLDADRVREGPEEPGFERLQRAGGHVSTIYEYIVCAHAPCRARDTTTGDTDYVALCGMYAAPTTSISELPGIHASAKHDRGGAPYFVPCQ